MRLRDDPPVHLTYCLNIHPGETWTENMAAIRDHALRVKALVAPDRPFGLGLRLGSWAATTLAEKECLNDFKRFLDEHNLYVFTINGFPYGAFHGTAVKAEVYRPDWRTAERLEYTNRLADILVELLPEGVAGSISTVPGSYKAWIETDDDVAAIARNLAACARHLEELRRRTGRTVAVALEPEPDCLIENTDEAVDFFTGPLRQQADAEMIARHLGVCVDACHLAVEFEDISESLRRLDEAGVGVPKVQLSAALRCSPSAAACERLREFCDPVYLHQVKVRKADGRVVGYPDLAEALKTERPTDPAREEWRVHFHVPLFFEEFGELTSTATLLTPEACRLLTGGVTEHLEIETYTFGVLPDALRETDVVRNIAREYEWVLKHLSGPASLSP